MTDAPSLWAQARRLLARGRETPLAERAAWLASEIPDPALRAEVAALLDAEDGVGETGFLNVSAAEHAAPLLAYEPDAYAGVQVGPWRLAERIGEGGMGVVYRAERADGLYEQTAALKLLARRIAPEALRERFRQERRILARLEHPGIARLIDGGVTDDGQPYFAMEYVQGQPLTVHADARGLGVEARVQLMISVCESVAHAHRHLVVHRDLKPSNILVDGRQNAAGASAGDEAGERTHLQAAPSRISPSTSPRVKLLDFGIAKLIDDGDADETRTAALLTPAYAAPEQVRPALGGITTATDVYALGAILYELLAGRRPTKIGPSMAPSEIEYAICDIQPPAPSTVASRARGRALRGDLDTIVEKAMRTAPEARYASADALADDLRRHLAGLPITARPATVGYRMRSFVRRHPVGVSATALVALALLLGLAGTAWQARVASGERDVARREAARAEQTADFLRGLFAASDPLNPEAEGDTLRARTLLLRGADRLGSDLAEQPEVRASLLREIGVSLRNLGAYTAADSLLQVSAHLLRQRPAALATTLYERSLTLDRLGDYEGVTETARRALALRRAVLSTDDPALGQAMDWMATVHEWNGQPDSALALEREAIALLRAAVSPTDDRLMQARHNLGWILQRHGDYAASDRVFREAVSDVRATAPDHPELPATLGLWAVTLRHLGRLDAAEALYREVLDAQRQRLGPSHPEVANTLNNLARIPMERGDLDAAEALYREALAISRQRRGHDAHENGVILTHLASIARRRSLLADAEPLAREALAIHTAAFPDGSPYTASTQIELGRILLARGQHTSAAPLAQAALASREAQFGPSHPRTQEARDLLTRTAR